MGRVSDESGVDFDAPDALVGEVAKELREQEAAIR